MALGESEVAPAGKTGGGPEDPPPGESTTWSGPELPGAVGLAAALAVVVRARTDRRRAIGLRDREDVGRRGVRRDLVRVGVRGGERHRGGEAGVGQRGGALGV